jgi:hypothetical protein
VDKPSVVRIPPVASALGVVRSRVLGARAVSRRRRAVALTVAIVADALQLVLWPAFSGGAASPVDDALDAVVALVLLGTLGFSGRLALALALELVPGADLFPTWTAVVLTIPIQPADAPAAAELVKPS